MGRAKIIFPPQQFLMTRVRAAGTPHSLQSLHTESWENWQKWARGENSHQSQLFRSLSVVPGEERKVKFHVVLSFPNADGQGKKKKIKNYILNWDLWICFWVPIGCGSRLFHRQLLPSCLSRFVSWELELAAVRLGAPKIQADKNVGC